MCNSNPQFQPPNLRSGQVPPAILNRLETARSDAEASGCAIMGEGVSYYSGLLFRWCSDGVRFWFF